MEKYYSSIEDWLKFLTDDEEKRKMGSAYFKGLIELAFRDGQIFILSEDVKNLKNKLK